MRAQRIRIATGGRSPIIADTTTLGSSTVELTVVSARPSRSSEAAGEAPLLHTPFLVAFAAARSPRDSGRAVTTSTCRSCSRTSTTRAGPIGMVMLVNAAAGHGRPARRRRLERPPRTIGPRPPAPVHRRAARSSPPAGCSLSPSASRELYLVLALAAGGRVHGPERRHDRAPVARRRALLARRAARATSAQELAMLVGGLLGLVVGGLLTEVSRGRRSSSPRSSSRLLTLPTLRRTRGARGDRGPRDHRRASALGYYFHAASRPASAPSSRRSLWVLGYAALPTFFLLYAKEEIGLRPWVASIRLAGFGIVTGFAIVAGRARGASSSTAASRRAWCSSASASSASRRRPASSRSRRPCSRRQRVRPRSSVLGFPLFSDVPQGRGGRLHRALLLRPLDLVGDALPAAGWTVDATGSYRSIFVLGGLALTALVPLVGVSSHPAPARDRRAPRHRAGAGALAPDRAQPRARARRGGAYKAINGLGPGPAVPLDAASTRTRGTT